MSKLMEVIELTDGDLASGPPVIKRLAEIGSKLPLESIQCVERLLLGGGGRRSYLAGFPEVESILRAAFSSEDPLVIASAHRIVNSLAEQGDMRFRGLVESS
jgi:hypothetical protein